MTNELYIKKLFYSNKELINKFFLINRNLEHNLLLTILNFYSFLNSYQ